MMRVENRRVLVTGGSGFIGSTVCRQLILSKRYHVTNVDKITYAGTPSSLSDLTSSASYEFHQADICDERTLLEILHQNGINAIIHLAAESHVDRSIDAPAAVIETNIIGTFTLLNATLSYWRSLSPEIKEAFRFLHVSTDEVFGDLPYNNSSFDEKSSYAPSSPYSASKASADHLVRAWHRTFGLPVLISNCSNNFGPYQFPEKLIPLTILNALEEEPIALYGDGANVRDWLFVEDHAHALELVLTRGRIGETYLFGGRSERSNIVVANTICDLLDLKRPRKHGSSHRNLIEFVPNRPGHDRRYAINPTKAEQELGWRSRQPFEMLLSETIDWYLDNEWWWRPIRRDYAGQRLGIADPSP